MPGREPTVPKPTLASILAERGFVVPAGMELNRSDLEGSLLGHGFYVVTIPTPNLDVHISNLTALVNFERNWSEWTVVFGGENDYFGFTEEQDAVCFRLLAS